MFDPYRKWLGIPERFRPPTHYQLLALSDDEQDREVIEAAVVRQSAYVRNFQNGPHAEDATRLLNEIAAARGCLLNAAKRAEYDAKLRPVLANPQPTPPRDLPRGVAVPTAKGVLPSTNATKIPPKPGANPAPATGSLLQPMVVRPATLGDTLTPDDMDATKVNPGLSPVKRPIGPATPRSQPKPAIPGVLGQPMESSLDRLMAAHLHAPAIRNKSTGTGPSKQVVLAAFGALGVVLLVVVIIAVANALFDSGPHANIASRPATAPPKPNSAPTAANRKIPPKPRFPPSKPSAANSDGESFGLALEPIRPLPAPQPVAPPPGDPSDPVFNAGPPNANPSNADFGNIPANPPVQSQPGAAPDGAMTGGIPQPFRTAIPSPPVPDPALTPETSPPGSFTRFQPRLKQYEDRPLGEIRRLELMTTSATAIAFSAAGRQVAAALSDGHVLLWNTENPEDFTTIENVGQLHAPITALTYTPDDKLLLVATSDGRIRGLSMQDDRHAEVVQFSEHLKGARKMVFFNDGASVMSGGDDRTVRVWTLIDGKQSTFFPGFRGSVTCLWVAEDGSRFIASDSRTVGIAGLDGKKPPRNFNITPPANDRATLSPDGHFLVWPDGRGFNVRDLNSSRIVQPFPDDAVKLMGEARFSPDGQLLATSNLSDPGIAVWDFASRKKLAVLESHSMRLSDVAFAPDNRLLASSARDATLRVWRLPELASFKKQAAQAAKASADDAGN